MDCVQIQFAIDDLAAGEAIVDELLVERLVACGQVTGPMISCYRWGGALERSEEWLVLLKTRAELAEQVTDLIAARHHYELPEVVTLPIVGGTAAYLRWIGTETSDGDGVG
jgi:periplasmic divalent cation tolerance protein